MTLRLCSYFLSRWFSGMPVEKPMLQTCRERKYCIGSVPQTILFIDLMLQTTGEDYNRSRGGGGRGGGRYDRRRSRSRSRSRGRGGGGGRGGRDRPHRTPFTLGVDNLSSRCE